MQNEQPRSVVSDAGSHSDILPEGDGTSHRTTSDREHPQPRLVVGGLCLVAGLLLLTLIVVEATSDLPLDLPRGCYTGRPLWFALALALVGIGWRLQRTIPETPVAWTPTRPGRRFQRLVIYTREDCHLCDDAKAILAEYSTWLPVIEEIDITGRSELEDKFGTSIPVVQIDGVVRFRGRVSELLLRRLIEGTPSDGGPEVST
ncbi:MAG: glutaredoxin family protein [Planctomycetales bacterium]|nr:glutaredoxin family protein [Planctomycetales bacterium]